MSEEDINEINELHTDFNDIDDLCLCLEIASKKSNIVIQEFSDTIIQLQQENKELRETIKADEKANLIIANDNKELRERIEYLERSIERKEETIICLQQELVPKVMLEKEISNI